MDMNEILTQFVKPELLVLVPVLYFIGLGWKKSGWKDKHIPFVLAAAGVFLAACWVLATSDLAGWQSALLAVFTAVVQGILCAGGAVLVNQSIKQAKKED